jgi:hypothetical protein
MDIEVSAGVTGKYEDGKIVFTDEENNTKSFEVGKNPEKKQRFKSPTTEIIDYIFKDVIVTLRQSSRIGLDSIVVVDKNDTERFLYNGILADNTAEDMKKVLDKPLGDPTDLEGGKKKKNKKKTVRRSKKKRTIRKKF